LRPAASCVHVNQGSGPISGRVLHTGFAFRRKSFPTERTYFDNHPRLHPFHGEFPLSGRSEADGVAYGRPAFAEPLVSRPAEKRLNLFGAGNECSDTPPTDLNSLTGSQSISLLVENGKDLEIEVCARCRVAAKLRHLCFRSPSNPPNFSKDCEVTQRKQLWKCSVLKRSALIEASDSRVSGQLSW